MSFSKLWKLTGAMLSSVRNGPRGDFGLVGDGGVVVGDSFVGVEGSGTVTATGSSFSCSAAGCAARKDN